MKNQVFVFLSLLLLLACQPKQSEEALPEFMAHLPLQTFEIDPKKGGTLVGKKGAILSIEPQSFSQANGQLQEAPVLIEFIEVQNLEEAALAGLGTVTDKGELLQSAGMYYINAKDLRSQAPLSLAKPLRLDAQSLFFEPNMKQFQGLVQDGKLLWTQPQELLKTMKPFPPELLQARQAKAQLMQTPLNDILYTYKDMCADLNGELMASTPELQLRRDLLRSICEPDFLKYYIDGVADTYLYLIDGLVAMQLGYRDDERAQIFRDLAAMKTRCIEGAKPNYEEIERLETYLAQHEADIKAHLKAMKEREERISKGREAARKELEASIQESGFDIPSNYAVAVSTLGWVNLDAYLISTDVTSSVHVKVNLGKTPPMRKVSLVVVNFGVNIELDRDAQAWSVEIKNLPHTEILLVGKDKADKLYTKAYTFSGQAEWNLDFENSLTDEEVLAVLRAAAQPPKTIQVDKNIDRSKDCCVEESESKPSMQM